MKTRAWIAGWFAIVLIALIMIGGFVYHIDPYFHYHKPYTDNYYYTLNNQRSQNDGISKHFEYTALITGTSMTENFMTSEVEEIFGVDSVKVPYSGASYKEINNNLINALKYNQDLKMIFRGLDTGMFLDTPNRMRNELGIFPTYLYDDNPFNDVKYLFNKDVIFSRAYAMSLDNDVDGFEPGITQFDDYSRWQSAYAFGIHSVMPDGVEYKGVGEAVHLSEEEKSTIYENITQNVTSLADEYPETEFYYFFTPYSILWYQGRVENGTIYRQIEAEQYVIELILEHENIKLFSFNGIEDLITDINNYKDEMHYAAWVNSYMLRCMYENEYRLTKDNYKEYLVRELDLFVNFDYNSLNNQVDWANDYYSAALMNERIWNVEPIDILSEYKESVELSNAELVSNQYKNTKGIRCVGTLQRDSKTDLDEYIRSREYVGAKILIKDIGKYNYLVFYGKKVVNHGRPTVVVFDSDNNKVGGFSESWSNLDTEWHQYLIDLSGVEGDIIIYFNGGYVDNTGNMESEYIFSNIILY